MPQCVNGFVYVSAPPDSGLIASVASSSTAGLKSEIGAGFGALVFILLLNVIDVAVQKASGRRVLLL